MKRASSLSPVSWAFAIRDDGAGAGEHYGNTCPREACVNEVALEQEILLHLQRRFGTRTKSRRTSMLDIRRHQLNCQGSDLHREPTPSTACYGRVVAARPCRAGSWFTCRFCHLHPQLYPRRDVVRCRTLRTSGETAATNLAAMQPSRGTLNGRCPCGGYRCPTF